jgi:tRNA A-37 threonylcarbamoyl transferase component Bud32
MYGRLEDEKAFNSVRRLVQQEDYALHKLHALGLPVPRPHGFVELTPDREYMLVTEFFEGSVELGEADVTDEIINQGLEIVRHMWDAGLAHRDIKPANLLVRDGRLLLIDVSFVEIRPTPWRQAVDLANMMLCLALRSDARRVYELARRRFTVEEISEGFAAARGLALPSQLRKMIRDKGRDLHAEFIDLLPERPAPISIQRWSARRVVVVCLAVLAVLAGGSSFIDLVAYNDRLNTSLEARPSCGSLEPLWLIAQSVPSASRVPCVPALPAGMMLHDVRVGSDGTRLTFARILADGSPEESALVANFTTACDVTGSARVLTDEAGVQRWERTEPGADGRTVVLRSYVFPGGCLSERYLPPVGRPGPPIDEAILAVDLTTREALGQALHQRSGGRLRLDP